MDEAGEGDDEEDEVDEEAADEWTRQVEARRRAKRLRTRGRRG